MKNNGPIRVLQVIPSLSVGGSQSMVMNLYKAINREKVQFDFIVDHEKGTVLKPEIEKLGGKIYAFPSFNGTNILQVRKSWDRFFLEHPEYKILHTHSRSYASIYLPIAKKHGVTTIVHSHSTSNGSGIKAAIKDLMQLPIRRQADYMFACSEDAGKWLFGSKAINSDSFRVVANGINAEDFSFSASERNNVRKQLNVSDEIVIGHSGRFHEAKNHIFLLEIFAEFKKHNSNAKLLLIGDGVLRKTIEKEIDRLNIKDSVILTGMVRNLAPYYSAMDIFAFPSKWEGVPVSVVEAQAAGLPCLVSDRITKQVCFSELVYALPIDEGPGVWVKAIEDIDLSRKDVKESILSSGFDINSTAKELEMFYKGIANE